MKMIYWKSLYLSNHFHSSFTHVMHSLMHKWVHKGDHALVLHMCIIYIWKWVQSNDPLGLIIGTQYFSKGNYTSSYWFTWKMKEWDILGERNGSWLIRIGKWMVNFHKKKVFYFTLQKWIQASEENELSLVISTFNTLIKVSGSFDMV